MTMTLVSTVTVGSGGAASIEFTNIPQTGKDLRLVLSGRGTFSYGGSTTWIDIYVQFNNTGNNNFSRILLQGTGSSTSSSGGPNNNLFMSDSGTTSNTFGNSEMYVANYTSSANKSFSADNTTENNATNATQILVAGLKSDTAAITRIYLEPSAGQFAQYSTASLYIIS